MRPLNVEMGHWLVFNAEREVVRCHCGFEADVATDSGYGDSVVDHLLSINIDARDRARDIAVALEQRLARIEALPAEFDSEVDWSSGRWDYGDNAAWESAARQLRAALEADQ